MNVLVVYTVCCTVQCVLSTQILDDPSGNSFLENPKAPQSDPCLTVEYYDRDAQQDADLGIIPATVSQRGKGGVPLYPVHTLSFRTVLSGYIWYSMVCSHLSLTLV